MSAKEILKRFREAIKYQEEWAGSLIGHPDEEYYKDFMEEIKKAKQAYKTLRQIFKDLEMI